MIKNILRNGNSNRHSLLEEKILLRASPSTLEDGMLVKFYVRFYGAMQLMFAMVDFVITSLQLHLQLGTTHSYFMINNLCGFTNNLL